MDRHLYLYYTRPVGRILSQAVGAMEFFSKVLEF